MKGVEKLKVGDDIQFDSFLSTTKNFNAQISNRRIVFIIKSKSGKLIQNYSKYIGEEEVLFKTKTKFKTTEINYNYQRYIIHLEEL